MLCVVLCWADRADAHEEDKINAYDRASVRLSLPIFGGGNLALGDFEYFELLFLGVEASYVYKSKFMVEGFMLSTLGMESYGGSWGVRTGLVLPGPGGSRAWRSYIVPAIGYHFAKRALSDDGKYFSNHTHNTQASLAYEVHFGGPTAFTLKAIVGIDSAFVSNPGPEYYLESEVFDMGGMAGLWLGMSWWDVRAFE